jgi:integrase/recombinase XerD
MTFLFRRGARGNAGFMLAPLLYMLALAGIGAAVLYSSYSQILRSNAQMTSINAVRSQLQSAGTTLAASSTLDTSVNPNLVKPPAVYALATVAAGADAAKLPSNYAAASSSGSPTDVGVVDTSTGVRRSGAEAGLYAADGARKYLNRDERQRVLAAVGQLPTDRALFALTLAWTGARVSEVLALTPSSFQIDGGVVAIRTLKRRRHHIREVPLPPELMKALDDQFHLAARQRDPRRADSRLWPWHRATAWRIVKRVMTLCQIRGRRASPRGLRHAFGVGTLQSGVPLNITQRWLGHAKIDTTAIYAEVSGAEERAFAEQFWQQSLERPNMTAKYEPTSSANRKRVFLAS